jgi:hypothetical protein
MRFVGDRPWFHRRGQGRDRLLHHRYSRWVLALPLADATSGFRAYRADLVARLDLPSVRADGSRSRRLPREPLDALENLTKEAARHVEGCL